MRRKKHHWLKWFLGLDLFLSAVLAGLYWHDEGRLPSPVLLSDWLSQAKQTIGGMPEQPPTAVTPLNIPLIKQYPQLPRGCEVTSLAMLLNYAGVDVNKLTLAHAIHKVPYSADGRYGDPEKGFVGNMYRSDQPGYGVYHQPLVRLADHYLPNRITDLSGKSFTAVEEKLSEGKPVLVIINTTFRPLASSAFQTWSTKNGTVRVTYFEHAVLLTGYTPDSVFFNNPLGGKNMSVNKEAFIKAWQQMGSQAISYRDFPGI